MKKKENKINSFQSVAIKLKRLLKPNEEHKEGDIYLRLHRAISWLHSSEINNSQIDLKFISLWISFNCCYAIDDLSCLGQEKEKEKDSIDKFLTKLADKDKNSLIYNILWSRFSQEINSLLYNKYIFKPYWDFERGIITESDFENRLNKSNTNFFKNITDKTKTKELLDELLRRLYVIRNQLLHGGATYNSSVNRQQIRDACKILEKLIPAIIEIMIENKDEDWGKCFFPVIKKPQ
jgi:hypothetical protein